MQLCFNLTTFCPYSLLVLVLQSRWDPVGRAAPEGPFHPVMVTHVPSASKQCFNNSINQSLPCTCSISHPLFQLCSVVFISIFVLTSRKTRRGVGGGWGSSGIFWLAQCFGTGPKLAAPLVLPANQSTDSLWLLETPRKLPVFFLGGRIHYSIYY